MHIINLFDWRWKLCKFAMKAFADWTNMFDCDTVEANECLHDLADKYTPPPEEA
jgi:hypothetical protein